MSRRQRLIASTKSTATRATDGACEQAERYITGLFEAFGKIETHEVMSRPVPAEFGVDGYFFRYERHFVYWRKLSNGDIGIVTILHERMHQIDCCGTESVASCRNQAISNPHAGNSKANSGSSGPG